MSEQDRFDWNEDMEFESEGDVQEEYGDFEDPLDGFADYDEMSEYDDPSEDDSSTMDGGKSRDEAESEVAEIANEGQAEKNPTGEKSSVAMMKKNRRRGISAMGLGFLFTTSVLVAGVGVGGAILLAEGVHPASLWQPRNLLQFDQLLNFADHPLNILYMVTMGIVFLALLGSYKMSKAAAQANARTRDAEDMLDRLTVLSLDKQEEWQSQEFKEFPPAEAFIIRALGAWRLQQARQKRLTGVEGELHRLEKALSSNSRADLTGRFDHPAVGRLADEMLRYFDARDTAVRKLEEYESKDQGNNSEIVNLLQESRQWNGSTLDHMGVHCAALDELAGQMDNLARHLENSPNETGSTEGMMDIIEGIRQETVGQSLGGMADDQTVSELNDLVDRGSKLAFKIAMEVARLGLRGERLLPMSQSLEDLTTGFRQLADNVNDRDMETTQKQAANGVHKKLEILAALITQDDQSQLRDVTDEVQDFGPEAARISGKLTRMVDGFNDQEDRLVRIGTSISELTGMEFDSTAIPREAPIEAPVPSLNITDRKSTAGPVKSSLAPAPTNPFATAGPSILSTDEDLGNSDFSSSFLPEPNTLSVESSTGPEESADMSLSGDEEKVYDLEDLGASPVVELDTEDTGDNEETEEVFDLSSFGATPMVEDDNQIPIEAETPESGEEVYDLAEFGAFPLDQAVEPDQNDAAVEDDVFDLADFGAKPMN
ncbi:MAG: hypothetical protein KAH56_06660 [Candidatus Krumholzibacteria bacterium]|nr:hypothetical protein [Candidatus Krumholzibacteria bacterium]